MAKDVVQCLVLTLSLLPSRGSKGLLRVSVGPDAEVEKFYVGVGRRSLARKETIVDMTVTADGRVPQILEDGIDESDTVQDDVAKSVSISETRNIRRQGAPPVICDAGYVQEACHAISDMRGRSSVRPFEIAEQLNTDLASVISFLGHIGIDAQAAIAQKGEATKPILIGCTELCNKVVAKIPTDRLPPSSDVGGRPGDTERGESTVWDIDLSPDFLAGLSLLDGDQELHHHEDETKGEHSSSLFAQSSQFTKKKTFASQLQQSIDQVWANELEISSDRVAPENEPSESSDEADNAHATHVINAEDMVINVAQLFHIYPSLTHIRVASGENASLADLGATPEHFKRVAIILTTVGEAWLTRAIANFGDHYLPPAYEKWIGSSLTRRSFGTTREGCECKKSWCFGNNGCVHNYCGNPDSDSGGEWCIVENGDCQGTNWGYCYHPSTVGKNCKCKKEWTFNSQSINDCSNPDGDSGGPWCLVEDRSCQGTNWGYCMKPCGPSCQAIRSKLEQAKEWMQKIEFRYDSSGGGYGYVWTRNNAGAQVAANRIDLTNEKNVTNGKLQVQTPHWTETATDADKIMYLCPAWWNQCAISHGHHSWAAIGPSWCSPHAYGTMIDTIIHETLHHLPMGTKDYLYFRNKIPDFVIANSANEDVLNLVKYTADSIEYLAADNNGYHSTGR